MSKLFKIIILIAGLLFVFCCFAYTGGCDQPGFLYEGRYYYHVMGKGLFSYSPEDGCRFVSSGISLGESPTVVGDSAYYLKEKDLYKLDMETMQEDVLYVFPGNGERIVSVHFADAPDDLGRIPFSATVAASSPYEYEDRYYLFDTSSSHMEQVPELPEPAADEPAVIGKAIAEQTGLGGGSVLFDGHWLYIWQLGHRYPIRIYEVTFENGTASARYYRNVPLSQRGFDVPL